MKKLIPALLAIASLVGCGASYKVKETLPFTEPLGKFKSVQVVVSTDEPEGQDAVEPFRSALLGKLANKALFSSLTTAADPGAAELKIAVKLSGFHAVNTTSQAFFGTMAGTGKLTASVVVVEIKSDEEIGGFTVAGKSASGTAYSASTEGGINAAADGVVESLAKQK